MKRFVKGFLIFILVIGLIIGGIWLYFTFSSVRNLDIFSVVPEESIFVIETDNATKGWNALSKGKIWNHLKQNPLFAEYDEMVASLDSMMDNNSILEMLLEDRQVLISANMISKSDYDFLYVVNVDKAGKASFTSELAGFFDYSVAKRTYNNEEIIELTDAYTRETISLCFLGNVLTCSFSGSLVEKAIDQSTQPSVWTSQTFTEISQQLHGNSMFRFYLNNKMLKTFMSIYLTDNLDMAESFGNSTSFLASNIVLEEDNITLQGSLGIHDSIGSYIRAISKSTPAKTQSHRVVTEKAALYLNLGFSDFNQFFGELKNQFRQSDSLTHDEMDKDLNKIESFLSVDLQEDFFNWIGTEISMVKLSPSANSKEDDVVAYFSTKSLQQAQTGLNHLTKQIKRRTPVKFKEYDYNGFPISTLEIKGFFKLFLGDMFEKLEKPYFTYIDNYVVFSNSTGALMDAVDDYVHGKTLHNDKSFKSIFDEVSGTSNIFVYLNTPKYYKHMLKSSTPDSKKGLAENQDIILSFVDIGIEMVANGNKFDYFMKCQHNPDIFQNLKLLEIENAAEELDFAFYDTLGFMFNVSGIPLAEGPIELFYDNEAKQAEGSLMNNFPQGIWRMYYPSGNLMATLRFETGLLNGPSTFYYDESELIEKATFEYKKGIIQGEYKEFYRSGAIKCLLEIENGIPQGDAVFYYENEKIKMDGEYEDSLMDGKWKLYNELGKEVAKKKYEEGVEKE